MKSEYYSEFLGKKVSTNQVDTPQVSFLKLHNYIVQRTEGALVKRPGSTTWDVTGDQLGISSYSKESASYLVPNVEILIRHRRNAGTSYIEKLDWSASTWSAITLGANTSFGASGIMQTAQYSTLMCICAGRPAKITDISSGSISRLGGPAPTAAPTWGVSGTGLSGRTMGCYTFYDSTTGWESSPSPVTALTTVANQQIDWSGLETTCAREGVDKKRLYRTQLGADGDTPFYRVTELSLATTTYADTVADTSLTATAPEANDHDPPPTSSYVCAEYAGVLWIADGNALYYSKPYDGSNASLEYFSINRVFYFPARVTALAYTPDFGRLLVFLPSGKGIYSISGRSHETFEIDVFRDGEGTNFTTSVSSHGDLVAYWGHAGPAIVSSNGVVVEAAKDLKEEIREIGTRDYNSDVYIVSKWQPVLGQFIWFVAATDTTFAQWEDSITGVTVNWEDSVTGALVEWE